MNYYERRAHAFSSAKLSISYELTRWNWASKSLEAITTWPGSPLAIPLKSYFVFVRHLAVAEANVSWGSSPDSKLQLLFIILLSSWMCDVNSRYRLLLLSGIPFGWKTNIAFIQNSSLRQCLAKSLCIRKTELFRSLWLINVYVVWYFDPDQFIGFEVLHVEWNP